MPSRAWGGRSCAPRTHSGATGCSGRTGWRRCWKRPPSSCPAWSRICWARRLLKALGEGETDAAALAALADYGWRAPSEQWRDALGACQELDPVYRRLLKAALEELELLEKPMGRLDQEVAELLRSHQDQVQRLAEVPGLGVDSAQPIMAAVGAQNLELSSLNGRHW